MGDRRDRKVAVEHEQAGRRDDVPGLVDVPGPDRSDRRHVRDRNQQLSVRVENRGVGAGRLVRSVHVLAAHSGRNRLAQQTVAQRVATYGADQVRPNSEPREVLRDVAADTTRRHRSPPGVAGLRRRARRAVGLDVDVRPTDDHDARLLAEDVAPAEDDALLTEVRQVDVDRCPRRPEQAGDCLGADQRVAA